jgi:hypothetical protein
LSIYAASLARIRKKKKIGDIHTHAHEIIVQYKQTSPSLIFSRFELESKRIARQHTIQITLAIFPEKNLSKKISRATN